MAYTLAVFSDIHSNIVALDTVLEDIESQFSEVTEYLCPGDLVGYGPNPREVLQRVFKEEKLIAISKGNHDHGVGLGRGGDSTHYQKYIKKFNTYAQEAIRWHVELLTTEEKNSVYKLPSSQTCLHQGYKTQIALIHGSPEYPLDEYVFPGSQQQKSLFPFMELFEVGVLLLGHTHIPFVDTMESEKGPLLMCNPGSVGQPRDRDPRASYAVIDMDDCSAEIIRVEYDIPKVQSDILSVGLPTYLAERLAQGK
ncbi:MAG: metallophosphoesterase family protein [Candidatus Thorarchaeota archaeon]